MNQQTAQMPDLEALEKILGIRFKKKRLLLTAITHRSYLNEHRNENAEHYERLEYLGDAVLELIVTKHLYITLPDPEGHLTDLRAYLVKGKTLGKIGEQLGLIRFVRMGKGERRASQPGFKNRMHMLACIIEAIIGAIYMDRGIGVAELFVHQFIFPLLEKVRYQEVKGSKTLLQEISQEKLGITPIYRLMSQEGPTHSLTFVVGVILEEKIVGVGSGGSKKEAETKAAKEALKNEFNIKT